MGKYGFVTNELEALAKAIDGNIRLLTYHINDSDDTEEITIEYNSGCFKFVDVTGCNLRAIAMGVLSVMS